jgi:hypothetical protein
MRAMRAQLRAQAAHPGLRLDIIKRCDPAPKGFALQPKRRLARDYETNPSSSEAFIFVHASKIMLRILAR